MNSRFYYALPPDVASPDRLYRNHINNMNVYANPIPELYSPSQAQYYSPPPGQSRTPETSPSHEQRASILPGGTMLHKGFYDLLALIPTTAAASASRFLWGSPRDDETVSGPRYEQLPAEPNRPKQTQQAPPQQTAHQTSPPASPPNILKKTRRISKDMVSKPTGFMYVLRSSGLCIKK